VRYLVVIAWLLVFNITNVAPLRVGTELGRGNLPSWFNGVDLHVSINRPWYGGTEIVQELATCGSLIRYSSWLCNIQTGCVIDRLLKSFDVSAHAHLAEVLVVGIEKSRLDMSF